MHVPAADGILEMEIYQTFRMTGNALRDRLELAEKVPNVERQAECGRRKFEKLLKLPDRCDEHSGFRLKRDLNVPLSGMLGKNAQFIAKP